ncbi:ATP-binding protein [Anaeromyxobacter oryzisoli]|uniref:ATP-binding protein n=1 Tax=Anaeromyxobacter oryzisoli TaxID=2925408 RepID=UPI001F5A3AE0|nr:ATP-binding protein [Anaeromyxobacter sp. SG63]
MRLVANEVADEDVLELTLAPDWAAVRAVGDRCRSALAGAGLERDEAYALAMVAQELVENAVKYGAAGPGEVVRLRLRVDSDAVTVEVVNHLGVDDAHLRTFERTVEWIRGFQDPFEAYVERLKEISATPYADGRSGLGLARIAYEGRCALDFYAGPGDTLAVSAIHEREGGTP